jgi:hypothetical protein
MRHSDRISAATCCHQNSTAVPTREDFAEGPHHFNASVHQLAFACPVTRAQRACYLHYPARSPDHLVVPLVKHVAHLEHVSACAFLQLLEHSLAFRLEQGLGKEELL